MIISDLEHLEVVREDKSVKGGYADAYAYTSAFASGSQIAITYTNAFTITVAGSSYLSYYSPGFRPY